jgi:hypothetical protein
MSTKPKAVITTADSSVTVVVIQREHEGWYWATSGQQNSDKGWTLKANGEARREVYRDGERISSVRVGTWKLKEPTVRKFIGSEIASAIVNAVEALDRDEQIVTFSAGENMPITAGIHREDEGIDQIPEFAWDGEHWNEIGYL